MPATVSIGRESCRGRTASGRSCLAIQYPRPTVEIPGPFPGSSPKVRWVRRGGRLPHWWELNSTEVQAQADAASVEVVGLLCRGCQIKLIRLTEEGTWPA